MMDRLSKLQIVVAAIAAVALELLRQTATDFGEWPTALEALSFLLCVAAILKSGRELRLRFEQLGSDKKQALDSPDYMTRRSSLRLWSYFAALIIASLAAPHFQAQVIPTVLAIAVALPAGILIADGASGWRRKPL